jgi:hypothetical protein
LGERLRKLGAVGESRKTMPKSFMENYDGMNDGDELPEIDAKQENNE